MSTYRITIDPSLCSGFGSCVDLAPSLFRLDSGGIASAITAETGDRNVLDAVAACPMAAISVSETASESRAA